jgi:DNA mismatch repair protein MutS2
MIYPQDFETKTGFDRIRLILSEYCQSPMGQQLVSALKFLDNPAEIKYRIATTYEFQQIL